MIAMENVPGAALSPQFERLLKRLDVAGYKVAWDILNGAHYGSVQSRQRLSQSERNHWWNSTVITLTLPPRRSTSASSR